MLKSTGSEFKGFLVDEYTTLPEADDRILATSLTARWRYADRGRVDWNAAYDDVRALLLATFATTYSRALQETLYAMGRAVLEAPTTRSRRSRSPPPTSTTSWSTSRRSGSRTRARCSSPPTGPTD